MIRKDEEHKHQVAVIKWFRHTYPDDLIFAIPNGGKRNAREASRLKAEGVLAGVPDLHVPKYKLYIEMKAKDGKVSKAQQNIIQQLTKDGYNCHVAYSFLEARRIIEHYIENYTSI